MGYPLVDMDLAGHAVKLTRSVQNGSVKWVAKTHPALLRASLNAMPSSRTGSAPATKISKFVSIFRARKAGNLTKWWQILHL